jgi:hypothetical protein
MKLELKQVTIFGIRKKQWQASLGGDVLATGQMKAEVESEAMTRLHRLYECSFERPAMAVCADGTILSVVPTGVATDGQKLVTIYTYDADGAKRGGCCISTLTIQGERVTLGQMATYYKLMRDGVDCFDAADAATGRKAKACA